MNAGYFAYSMPLLPDLTEAGGDKDSAPHGAGWRAVAGDSIVAKCGLFKQRRKIPCPVQHPRDFNPVFHRAIKDDLVAHGKTSQPGCQFLALPPQAWHCRQPGEPGNNCPDEPVRRVRVVLCNVEPDLIQIRTHRVGNPISVHAPDFLRSFFSRSRPVRPTSSASCMTLVSS